MEAIAIGTFLLIFGIFILSRTKKDFIEVLTIEKDLSEKGIAKLENSVIKDNLTEEQRREKEEEEKIKRLINPDYEPPQQDEYISQDRYVEFDEEDYIEEEAISILRKSEILDVIKYKEKGTTFITMRSGKVVETKESLEKIKKKLGYKEENTYLCRSKI